MNTLTHVSNDTALSVALIEQLQALAGESQLVFHAQKPWERGGFAGSQHNIAVLFDRADNALAFETALADHEFAQAGHIVIEAVGYSVKHRDCDGILVVAELIVVPED